MLPLGKPLHLTRLMSVGQLPSHASAIYDHSPFPARAQSQWGPGGAEAERRAP